MSRSTLTVFYGPKEVTDGAVLTEIAKAIDNHKDYVFSNQSMGGDPQVGTYKYAMVSYALQPRGSPIRSRIAGEGGSLSFGTDIQSITYGSAVIDGSAISGSDRVTDRTIYRRVYKAFISNTPYPVNDFTMGGHVEGNAKGEVYYYRNEQPVVREIVDEGGYFTWS